MPKGIRENPSTLTIDIVWSPSRKTYVMTVSYLGGSGRHGERFYRTLTNDNRPEIDSEGARLLADALEETYGRWLF